MPFTDIEFPARRSSIYRKDDEIPGDKKEIYNNLIWKRASKIFRNPQLFLEKIEPIEINKTPTI